MISHHNVVVFKLFYSRFRQLYAAQKMQPKERGKNCIVILIPLSLCRRDQPLILV